MFSIFKIQLKRKRIKKFRKMNKSKSRPVMININMSVIINIITIWKMLNELIISLEILL